MEQEQFRISGRVIDRRTQRGVSGLRVAAWDKDTRYHDLLGERLTDNDGRFQIAFDASYFGDFAPDRLPDLFFRVYRGNVLVKSTEDTVQWNVAAGERDVVITIDLPSEEAAAPDRVSAGQVLQSVEFIRRSDFSGVWRDTTAKASGFGSVVADAVKAGIANMNVAPIKPDAVKTRDVVNQDVATARKNLGDRQVEVNEVKSYEPGVNARAVSAFAPTSRLRPGDKVDLYEENGRVRYYALVREDDETRTAKGATADANVMEEMQAMKERMTAFDAMREELDTLKKQASTKNRQIASMQAEIKKLRGKQS